MAGKIHKVRLFQRWGWLRHLPDLRTIRMFLPHFLHATQGLPRRLAADWRSSRSSPPRASASRPATDYAPELLVQDGQLTRRGPTAWQQKDIEFGWQMAKEMGRLDIGQSVAVKDQAVLAVEAVEGTDECIRRAGALCPAGGFTVVKVAKPQQDMRFDVPTIGLGTLETLVAAGGRVLAVEAGRTIFLDQAAVVEYADRHGLVIVAIDPHAAESLGAASEVGG